MSHSTPGLPVHHQLPEFTQTHIHWVGDAIQPSHPLSSPPPPTFDLSQHQGLFQWVSSSHQVLQVLEFQLQHQSFQSMTMQDWFPLGWTGLTSLQSKGISRVFSNTTVQKHQFFSTQLSLRILKYLSIFIGEGNGNPLQYACLENPWTEEPGGLLSTGLHRVGHTEGT